MSARKVSSLVITVRACAVRGRSSCGQGKFAGAVGTTLLDARDQIFREEHLTSSGGSTDYPLGDSDGSLRRRRFCRSSPSLLM